MFPIKTTPVFSFKPAESSFALAISSSETGVTPPFTFSAYTHTSPEYDGFLSPRSYNSADFKDSSLEIFW
ncbi:MAG: hypothetical protein M1308_22495 [Actinobacteria bacterium]|nr:hypothetical protein [Actinomycetota bacterium]